MKNLQEGFFGPQQDNQQKSILNIRIHPRDVCDLREYNNPDDYDDGFYGYPYDPNCDLDVGGAIYDAISNEFEELQETNPAPITNIDKYLMDTLGKLDEYIPYCEMGEWYDENVIGKLTSADECELLDTQETEIREDGYASYNIYELYVYRDEDFPVFFVVQWQSFNDEDGSSSDLDYEEVPLNGVWLVGPLILPKKLNTSNKNYPTDTINYPY